MSFCVCAATCYGAAIGRVGRNADGKGLRDVSEVGDKGAIASHSEVIAGVGGDHGAVFSPVGEGIVGIGCGSYGARLSFCVGAATCYGATIGRVGRNTDGVVLGLL